jgi:dimethylargininase
MPANAAYSYAIVRKPCKNIVNGISAAGLGKPDYETALVQHERYVEALCTCGLEVTVLEANEQHPDSVFVEDPAILTPRCAVVTNPGADSRKGETESIRQALEEYYDPIAIKTITEPGTLEGGDVLRAGNHYYIGLSERTNAEGARQLIDILITHGMTGSLIEVGDILHLKTGLSYLENGHILGLRQFSKRPEFEPFTFIPVEPDEAYAANCLWINGTVLVPANHPETLRSIERVGYDTIALDISEFRKLDGGLSCLSLRF